MSVFSWFYLLFLSTRKRLFGHLTSSRLFTSVKAHFLLVANEDYFCFEVDLHTFTNTHAGILRRKDNILTSIALSNSAFFITIDSEPSKPRFYIIPSKKKTIPPRLDRRSKDSCCSLDAWWIRHEICQKNVDRWSCELQQIPLHEVYPSAKNVHALEWSCCSHHSSLTGFREFWPNVVFFVKNKFCRL